MKPRFLKLTIELFLTAALLAGCWDIKNIQDINYLSAVGVDFENNEYVVYVQMLDFSTIAKQEGAAKPSQPIEPWVGKAKGDNLILAINKLYKSSQQQLFYGHVSAIVCSEEVLKKNGLDQVLDALNRYREFRYPAWVFGTKESIELIFTTQPFFNQSPINSILHEPMESYKQESSIIPIQLRQFVLDYREPGKTSFLPSLTLTTQNWKQGNKNHPLLIIDGSYALHAESYMGWLSENQLVGWRWLERKTKRAPLVITMDGKPVVTLSLEDPEVKITSLLTDRKPIFNVDIATTGYISQETKKLPDSVIEKEAEKQIEAEIVRTYQEGLKNKIDLLQLEYHLYRQNTEVWKQMGDNFQLTKDSLHSIHVDVNITNSGRYKSPYD